MNKHTEIHVNPLVAQSSSTRRITPCQKRLLTFLVKNNGQVIASIGHKEMDLGCVIRGTDIPCIKLSVVHVGPLKQKGFITSARRDEGGSWISITDAGRRSLLPSVRNQGHKSPPLD